jgi:hypothetical protein
MCNIAVHVLVKLHKGVNEYPSYYTIYEPDYPWL